MNTLSNELKALHVDTILVELPNHCEADVLDSLLKPAADALKAGETVAFPTETVYGIGADALNPEAVLKIFEAKNRPADNPLIVHITDRTDLDRLVSAVSEDAQKLMDAFWPGPLTLILPKAEGVSEAVTAGLNTVGVRMPAHPIAKRLIELAGCPVAAPSANVSGRPSPTCGKDVAEDLNGRVSVIVYGSDAAIGLESTVVDALGEEPIILRPGGVTLEMIQSLLGKGRYDEKLNEKLGAGDKPKSPGMKYTHYAPKAKVSVFVGSLEKVEAAIGASVNQAQSRGMKTGVLNVDELFGRFDAAIEYSLGSITDPDTAASRLFALLRDFDRAGVEEIYAVGYGEAGMGKALMNRLIKAAGHRVTYL